MDVGQGVGSAAVNRLVLVSDCDHWSQAAAVVNSLYHKQIRTMLRNADSQQG